MSDPNQPYDQQPGHAPDSDAALTRSEEELRIITVRRETQRARLIKYVQTETQTRTVEVRHERARVEYEPISEDAGESARPAGLAPSGDGWLVLYDEEIVLQRRWVARERVRLATRSVIENREISEDLRREQIEIDDTTRHMEDDHG